MAASAIPAQSMPAPRIVVLMHEGESLLLDNVAEAWTRNARSIRRIG